MKGPTTLDIDLHWREQPSSCRFADVVNFGLDGFLDVFLVIIGFGVVRFLLILSVRIQTLSILGEEIQYLAYALPLLALATSHPDATVAGLNRFWGIAAPWNAPLLLGLRDISTAFVTRHT